MRNSAEQDAANELVEEMKTFIGDIRDRVIADGQQWEIRAEAREAELLEVHAALEKFLYWLTATRNRVEELMDQEGLDKQWTTERVQHYISEADRADEAAVSAGVRLGYKWDRPNRTVPLRLPMPVARIEVDLKPNGGLPA